MKKFIRDTVRPSAGMWQHALVGALLALWFALALVFVESPVYIYSVCGLITVYGFAREFHQAGWSIKNFNTHKFIEGLAWCTCWPVAVLITTL